MYLKSLEIQGFKSFADKIKMEFGPGITAVVGPNGSGKSNISDAIRWVLGEQSIRSLRGSKMEDIIFAGTSKRKPLGMAEVSLCLDNHLGLLPLSYSEVTVTRRIYRSGESEYFINRNPCRLKDVHELFNDVGLGKDSLAIISQGNVEEILNSKPEERRHLIEQAAGIVKYRNRKREALKKLEDTEQSLVRLEDLLAELEVNLRPLQEEAEKAKTYRRLKKELDALEINLAVQELEKIFAEYQEIKRQAEIKKNLFLEKEKKYLQLKKSLEQQKLEFNRVSQELTALQQNLYQLAENLNQADHSLGVSQERRNSLTQQMERAKKELESYILKQTELRKKFELQIKNHDELLANIQATKKELKVKQDMVSHLDEAINGNEDQLEKLKNEIVNCLQEVSHVKNAINQAGYRYNYQQQALLKNREQVQGLTVQIEEAQKELKNILANFKEKQKALQQLLAEKEALESQLRELETAVKSKQNLYNAKQEELVNLHSRYQVLKDMHQSHEGYLQGVKAVLQAKDSGHPSCQGICGVVGELLLVPSEYEKAIEVALGSSLQFLVAETTRDAQSAISFLKEKRGGRATFLPLDAIQPRNLNETGRKLLGSPGVIGLASELVEFDPVYELVVKHLLGHILIIKDLNTAVALAKKVNYSVKMVTLEGDVINPGGSLTGGSFNKKQTSLLNRLREIKNLELQMAERQREIKALELATNTLKNKLDEVAQQLNKVNGEIQSLQLQLTAEEQSIKKQKQDINTISQKIDLLNLERRNLEKELEQTREEQIAQQRSLVNLEDRHRELENETRVLQDSLRQEKERRKILEEELTSLKVELAALLQKERALQEELKIFHESDEEYDRLVKGCKEEYQKLKTQREELAEFIAATEEKKFRLLREKKELENKVQLLTVSQEELKKVLSTLEKETIELAQELSEKKDQLHQLELQRAKLESEKNSQLKRLEEYYSLTYEEARKQKISLGPLKEVQNRLGQLRREVQSLGYVNLAAIEEYERLKGRFDFLQKQKQDLDEAKRSLEKVIQEIDQIMTSQFKTTFEQVNVAFGQIFKELFGGGQAYLELTTPDNLLETGLEIIAQPPGKKLQNLSLLSGGERALTVISLLFAILKVKPVPFCVLDEIEAALDEANVDRFARFLRAYADKTQFIVISHRQGTIEVADALYGVTMEEFGVSKLISVRLTQKEAKFESA